MEPQTVEAVIDAVDQAWGFETEPEITLEANPTSVEAGKFADFRSAGVNRVSMGVQSLREEDLRRLGRLHSVEEARAAFAVARAHFDRVSFDLIYARQDQSLTEWEEELKEAVDMAVDHLSLYQLTIEPQTTFGARYAAGKLAGLPEDALAADMYFLTNEVLSDAGYRAYEVSNHARPGAECQHNLIYWRGGAYAGIGPGAHGRLWQDGTWFASETELAPDAWLERPEPKLEQLTNADRGVEYLLMSLRLAEGCEVARLGDVEVSSTALKDLEAMGFLELTDERIIATKEGRTVLNTLLKQILV